MPGQRREEGLICGSRRLFGLRRNRRFDCHLRVPEVVGVRGPHDVRGIAFAETVVPESSTWAMMLIGFDAACSSESRARPRPHAWRYDGKKLAAILRSTRDRSIRAMSLSCTE